MTDGSPHGDYSGQPRQDNKLPGWLIALIVAIVLCYIAAAAFVLLGFAFFAVLAEELEELNM